MPASGGNVAVLQGFQAAIGRGAWDEAAELLHDDVVFHEAPSLPFGGEYKGVDGYRDLVARCGDVASFVFGDSPQFHETTEGAVVLVSDFTVTGIHTGRAVTTPFAEIYTFDDGKIADVLVFYWDEAAVVAALTGPA